MNNKRNLPSPYTTEIQDAANAFADAGWDLISRFSKEQETMQVVFLPIAGAGHTVRIEYRNGAVLTRISVLFKGER